MSETKRDKLEVLLTPEEEEETLGTKKLTFEIGNGSVLITEHWGEMDEAYGDGHMIKIPARVWALAVPWIQERMTP